MLMSASPASTGASKRGQTAPAVAAHVVVDEEVDVGLRRRLDTGRDGAALAAVGRQFEHGRTGRGCRRSRAVT